MAEELCVIFNPHSGRGRAAGRLERLRSQWGSHAAFWPTEQEGHGADLAYKAAENGFTVVAAAGGDGTVHEVANGLLSAGRPVVAFAVVPIGSANDYAHSLGVDSGAPPPAAERWVDVGTVRDARGRERYFVNCLGLGFNGKVTMEARRIKRLMLSVLLGRREGGFVLAPDAQLDDGLFDYVHTGDLSRLEVLRFLPRLALAGPPKNHPKVRLGRCRRFVLQSPTALTVHIDGEFFAQPEDDVCDLEIGLLPRALRVKLALGGGTA
jgi:diacylglycerol kinase (ATP)